MRSLKICSIMNSTIFNFIFLTSLKMLGMHVFRIREAYYTSSERRLLFNLALLKALLPLLRRLRDNHYTPRIHNVLFI